LKSSTYTTVNEISKAHAVN